MPLDVLHEGMDTALCRLSSFITDSMTVFSRRICISSQTMNLSIVQNSSGNTCDLDFEVNSVMFVRDAASRSWP